MQVSMSMRVPKGSYVDQSVADSFLGTELPINFPNGVVKPGTVTHVKVISERGLDDEGRNTSFDKGFTVTMECEEIGKLYV